MRRVLGRNGRLALSVWNNVGIYNTAEADFSDVEVSVSRINVHLPQIDGFVLEHLAATPVASAVEAADAETRRKIGANAKEQLQRYVEGDGISYPEETHVVTARLK